jgi:DNA primase large subunit
MKITKRQLRRIIKEEKRKLVLEMNPDGTISDNEDAEREAFLVEVEDQAEELVRFIQMEAERIGGDFRSPGIRKQAYRLVAELLHGLR